MNSAFEACAVEMLPHLPGFTIAPQKFDRCITLQRADGLAINLLLDWRKEQRVEVAPSVPAFEGSSRGLREWGVVSYNERGPSATFAIDRPPAAAAKVVARIVSLYAPMFAIIQQRAIAEKNRRDDTTTLATELATVLGKPLDVSRITRGQSVNVSLYGAFPALDLYGTADVTAESVTLELRSMKPATARAVLELLRQIDTEAAEFHKKLGR